MPPKKTKSKKKSTPKKKNTQSQIKRKTTLKKTTRKKAIPKRAAAAKTKRRTTNTRSTSRKTGTRKTARSQAVRVIIKSRKAPVKSVKKPSKKIKTVSVSPQKKVFAKKKKVSARKLSVKRSQSVESKKTVSFETETQRQQAIKKARFQTKSVSQKNRLYQRLASIRGTVSEKITQVEGSTGVMTFESLRESDRSRSARTAKLPKTEAVKEALPKVTTDRKTVETLDHPIISFKHKNIQQSQYVWRLVLALVLFIISGVLVAATFLSQSRLNLNLAKYMPRSTSFYLQLENFSQLSEVTNLFDEYIGLARLENVTDQLNSFTLQNISSFGYGLTPLADSAVASAWILQLSETQALALNAELQSKYTTTKINNTQYYLETSENLYLAVLDNALIIAENSSQMEEIGDNFNQDFSGLAGVIEQRNLNRPLDSGLLGWLYLDPTNLPLETLFAGQELPFTEKMITAARTLMQPRIIAANYSRGQIELTQIREEDQILERKTNLKDLREYLPSETTFYTAGTSFGATWARSVANLNKYSLGAYLVETFQSQLEKSLQLDIEEDILKFLSGAYLVVTDVQEDELNWAVALQTESNEVSQQKINELQGTILGWSTNTGLVSQAGVRPDGSTVIRKTIPVDVEAEILSEKVKDIDIFYTSGPDVERTIAYAIDGEYLLIATNRELLSNMLLAKQESSGFWNQNSRQEIEPSDRTRFETLFDWSILDNSQVEAVKVYFQEKFVDQRYELVESEGLLIKD